MKDEQIGVNGKLAWMSRIKGSEHRIVWVTVDKLYPTQKSWIVRESSKGSRIVIVEDRDGFAAVFLDQLPAGSVVREFTGNELSGTLSVERDAEDCKRVIESMVARAELGIKNTARHLNQR
tara:strand:+ start:249 stop:611 length:363 start_codon:yes stop_codon:yes gene_type:complete